MTKPILNLFHAIREGRFLYLALSLLGYLLLTPFLQDILRLQLIYMLFMTAVLLTSVFAVSSDRRHTVTAAALAVPMLLLDWMAYIYPSKALSLGANLVTLLFMGCVIVLILKFIFTTREVNRHVIFGAISVYLLIGFSWSILYSILENLSPGSFSQSPVSAASQPADVPASFAYFSFVTITTLGYGDITPLTRKAQSLAVGEAIIGQIYMTVLIAWLVGLYVSRKVTERNGEDDNSSGAL